MAVKKGCCESPQENTYETWQIDSSNMVNDSDMGGRTLVLWENTCTPPALFHENPSAWNETEINKLFSENYEEGKTVSINKNNRDMALYIMFGIGAMIVIATLFLLVTKNIDWAGTWSGMAKMFGGK
jgi:hypothetical protein